ncbi:WD40 repeat domain-containing protein [Alicyclobacillus ferrooxydans]|uniref:Uncharacterized protein n=1 Tax=Alicyclobacillus ferrooxydans TaxID=471514 RepID=A0A0P9EN33_9BACL|nr:WD40 repeat domain-containing protein [Alicyclobacillus ferrooxydans]KPV44832.1 hypothetical protein AN477_05310 [Alicyclobacillus ferrooxydans]
MKKSSWTAIAMWGALLTAGTIVMEGAMYHHEVLIIQPEVRTVQQEINTFNPSHAIAAPGIQNATLMGISNDGNFIAYVTSAKELNVTSVPTKATQTVAFPTPIIYVKWIENRSIFVVTSSGGTLTLYRYDLASGEKHMIQQFRGHQVQSIGFSPYTNDTYVIVGNGTDNAAYRFDTNGDFYSVVVSGITPLHAAVGETNITVYVESTAHTILAKSEVTGRTTVVAQNATLLAQMNNSIYFGSLSKGGITEVVKYANQTKQKVVQFNKPQNPSHIFVDRQGHVFSINGDYVTNQSIGQKWLIPKGNEAKCVQGGIVLVEKDAFKIVAY